MVHLNEGQEKAANDIVAFLQGKLDLPYFTLSGGPGTGKTYLLNEAIRRSGIPFNMFTAATIAHSAKNVLNNSFQGKISCYTVAQWLGLKMDYDDHGNIIFRTSYKSNKMLVEKSYAILDEASMINDELYDNLMEIVTAKNIKLIVVGDVHQLLPVGQDHSSKFFDSIHAMLTEPMRFKGPIGALARIFEDEIENIMNGYVPNKLVLNQKTNRIDNWDVSLNSGYKFKNNIYELLEQAALEIKSKIHDINYTRLLAFKNETIKLLNEEIRHRIFGANLMQFETNEIIISNGGFSKNNRPIIYNGEIFKVLDVKEIVGPYDIPCLSLKFDKFKPLDDVVVPIVQNTEEALKKYAKIKFELYEAAKRDRRQFPNYYRFIDEFAYFDYAYSVNCYKVQGQTLSNVYVMEGEIMNVKPISLKQKFQALYVSVTRATDALYIYNKNY